MICKVLFLSVSLILLTIVKDVVYPRGVYERDRRHLNRDLNSKLEYSGSENETRYPIVIWWSDFAVSERRVRSCPKGTCLFLEKREELHNPLTEAVMFYGSSVKWNDLPLPRRKDTYWALYHEESPKNNWGFAYLEGISMFNITATFSRHSSYTLFPMYLRSIDQIMTPMKYSTTEKSQGGKALVMYLHSDCGTPSDRDTIAAELMKYIAVDSYGKCLHNKDLPPNLQDPVTGMDSVELVDIIGQYKFVLTIENAICDDYITEKLWRTFEAGSVPVYKGSPSVKDWMPDEHSGILIDDFSSPRELANYLKYLDKNDEEYEKFLLYKKHGIKNKNILQQVAQRNYSIDGTDENDDVRGFECKVCDIIYDRKVNLQKGKVTAPLIANLNHYHCYFPRSTVKWWSSDVLFWQYEAWAKHREVKNSIESMSTKK